MDATAPTVTAFTLPDSATTLTVSISSFTATDNVAVTGYLVTETATLPLATAAGWSATAPDSTPSRAMAPTPCMRGPKTARGTCPASRSASVAITDATAPTVTSFAIPGTSTSLTVPHHELHGHGQCGGDGLPGDRIGHGSVGFSRWLSGTAPASHTFTSYGARPCMGGPKTARATCRQAGALPLRLRMPLSDCDLVCHNRVHRTT